MEEVVPQMKTLSETSTYGKFVVEPLDRGYGVTLGNSLRRVLLSSVQGAAITSVKIDGVLHEFQLIDGLKEDTTELLLNLKDLCVRIDPSLAARGGKHVIRIASEGAGRVTGADVLCPDGVEVMNPECYLATISDDGASLKMEMTIEVGRGYVVPDKQEGAVLPPIGTIPVSAAFTPVRKVNYLVEPRRVGFKTDYEGLTLEVTTNGTISPSVAISQASAILNGYYVRFMELAPDQGLALPASEEEQGTGDNTLIVDLGFSPRTRNCLSKANILTLGELKRLDQSDLLALRNFGKKSLDEVTAKLEQLRRESETAAPQEAEGMSSAEATEEPSAATEAPALDENAGDTDLDTDTGAEQ